VDRFLARLDDAPPLSALTGGIHLHTLLCPDEVAFRRVCAALQAAGILLTENP
jgi:transcriptional regulator of NAD metabolism